MMSTQKDPLNMTRLHFRKDHWIDLAKIMASWTIRNAQGAKPGEINARSLERCHTTAEAILHEITGVCLETCYETLSNFTGYKIPPPSLNARKGPRFQGLINAVMAGDMIDDAYLEVDE